MQNSVDPNETAHYEPSHLDLRCLQKPIIFGYGSERVIGTFALLWNKFLPFTGCTPQF